MTQPDWWKNPFDSLPGEFCFNKERFADARDILEAVVANGDSDEKRHAMFLLGGVYHNGPDDIKDLQKSSDWIQKAAALDQPEACLNAGLMALEVGVCVAVCVACP